MQIKSYRKTNENEDSFFKIEKPLKSINNKTVLEECKEVKLIKQKVLIKSN
jgi:hypothetical protein